MMRVISERCLEFQQELFVCFVDFEKAFDRVNWLRLFKILEKIGIDWRDRRMIAALYMNQTASVRTRSGNTERAEIGRGVRQGCILSPLIFNIYAEAMIRESLDDLEEGVKVGGMLVKSVRFADDQAMIARSEEGLQHMMNRTNEVVLDNGIRSMPRRTR